jgi:hypothetical protein
LHNLGLGHEIGLDADLLNVDYEEESNNYIEYGNAFSTLGDPQGALTLSPGFRKSLGWLEDNQFLEITAPGQYFLNHQYGYKVAANIYHPVFTDFKLFTLEHRKAIGLDQKLGEPDYGNVRNGLILYHSYSRKIIDPYPSQLDFIEDTSTDAISDSFFDPVSGIRIEIDEVTPQGIYFTVTHDTTVSCALPPLTDSLLTNPKIYSAHVCPEGLCTNSILSDGYYANVFASPNSITNLIYAVTIDFPVQLPSGCNYPGTSAIQATPLFTDSEIEGIINTSYSYPDYFYNFFNNGYVYELLTNNEPVIHNQKFKKFYSAKHNPTPGMYAFPFEFKNIVTQETLQKTFYLCTEGIACQ